MRTKRIYGVLALIVAMAMCFSLVGCSGKKADADPPSGKEETAGSESKELFIAEGEDGTVLVVEKDGTPAEGYSVDADGNIVGSDGKVVVEAAKVANLPSKEQPDDPEENQESGSPGVESAPSGGSGDGGSGSSGSSGGNSGSSSSSSSGGSTAKPSGGGDSGGTSSGGGGSSGGSSGGGNSPSGSESGGSSGGGGNSQQPAHTHSWHPVYETIEIPVYEKICYTVCAACGAKFGINNTEEEVDEHMKNHAVHGESSRTYTQYDDVQVGTQTVQDLDHYECSCGARKEV